MSQALDHKNKQIRKIHVVACLFIFILWNYIIKTFI